MRDWAVIYSKVVIYVTLLVVGIVTFVSLRLIWVKDFPKCRAKSCDTAFCQHAPEQVNVQSLKTGDIAMISYNGVRSVFSSAVYGSVWSHCGVIVVDKDDEPHVLELAAYREPYHSKVVRVPFITWAKINKNVKSIAIIPLNRPAPREPIESKFKWFGSRDVGIEGLSSRWTRFLSKRRLSSLPRDSIFIENGHVPPTSEIYSGAMLPSFVANSLPRRVKSALGLPASFAYLMTCHEMTISLLQEAGVFEKTYSPCSYLPSALTNRTVPTCAGYKYGEPYEVLVDAITEKN
jgi:hypothetical protein